MSDETTKGEQSVTVTAPPAATVTVDAQNPLPEPSFVWRRILAYIVIMTTLALAWYAADMFHDLGAADQLLKLLQWVIGLAGLVATFYYIAPSAVELAQIIQSARTMRSGLETAGRTDNDRPRGESPREPSRRPPREGTSSRPRDEVDAAPRSRRNV